MGGGPPAHHSPEVRQGPADFTTAPPANPRRSVVTRTGQSPATATRAGTGSRQRRRADATSFFTPRGAPPPRAGPLVSFLKCGGAPSPPLLLGACAPRNGSRLLPKPQALLE